MKPEEKDLIKLKLLTKIKYDYIVTANAQQLNLKNEFKLLSLSEKYLFSSMELTRAKEINSELTVLDQQVKDTILKIVQEKFWVNVDTTSLLWNSAKYNLTEIYSKLPENSECVDSEITSNWITSLWSLILDILHVTTIQEAVHISIWKDFKQFFKTVGFTNNNMIVQSLDRVYINGSFIECSDDECSGDFYYRNSNLYVNERLKSVLRAVATYEVEVATQNNSEINILEECQPDKFAFIDKLQKYYFNAENISTGKVFEPCSFDLKVLKALKLFKNGKFVLYFMDEADAFKFMNVAKNK